MKRIAAFCLSVVCLFSFIPSLSCFAVDGDPPDVITELAEPFDPEEPFEPPFVTYANNTAFNINQVQWFSFPQYLQDIVFSQSVISKSEIKIPMVLIRVGSSNYQIWVGYNYFVGYSSQNNRYYITRPTNDNYASSLNSQVYTATFKISDNSITKEWAVCSWTLNDGASAAYSTALVTKSSQTYDFYCYGGFVLAYSYQNYASVGLRYNSSSDSTAYYLSAKPGVYLDDNPAFIGYPNSLYPSITLSYFSPKTPQQQRDDTQGGILSQIKALPDKIKGFFTNLASSISGFFNALGDRISGFFDDIKQFLQDLFIPTDQDFEDFSNDFQKWIKGRLGVLYQAPELVITIFNRLVSFNPKTSDYQMTFPKLQAPEVKDGKVVWHDVTDETVVSFDFINQKPFSTLYQFYIAFVWLAFILMLINLITRKWNQLFGGHD